jgi:hypothetical protein
MMEVGEQEALKRVIEGLFVPRTGKIRGNFFLSALASSDNLSDKESHARN